MFRKSPDTMSFRGCPRLVFRGIHKAFPSDDRKSLQRVRYKVPEGGLQGELRQSWNPDMVFQEVVGAIQEVVETFFLLQLREGTRSTPHSFQSSKLIYGYVFRRYS